MTYQGEERQTDTETERDKETKTETDFIHKNKDFQQKPSLIVKLREREKLADRKKSKTGRHSTKLHTEIDRQVDRH